MVAFKYVKVKPEVNDGLCNLRSDAADDAFGTHQAGSRNSLDEMLRNERIDRRHAGDVDDRELGTRRDDLRQQGLHNNLRPCAVERADEWQREDRIPQMDSAQHR